MTDEELGCDPHEEHDAAPPQPASTVWTGVSEDLLLLHATKAEAVARYKKRIVTRLAPKALSEPANFD